MILFSIGKAQIVPIPDAHFKSKLLASTTTNSIASNQYGVSIKVDVNNDGQIQLTEALAIVKLNLSGSMIQDVSGINYFTNLKELYLGSNLYTSLTISLPNLEYLAAGADDLTSINISACPSLKKLNLRYNNTALVLNSNSVTSLTLVGGNNLQHANLQGCTALKNFTLQNGPSVQSVDGSNMPTLEEVFISYTPLLSQINFTGSPNFKSLSFLTVGLPSLDLTNYTTLQTLGGTGSSFSNVKLDGCTSLLNVNLPLNNIANISMNGANAITTLNLSDNHLTSVSLSNHPNLQSINFSDNLISNLTLTGLPGLEDLNVTSNQLSSLDLSGVNTIKTLTCSYNKLSNLNVSPLSQLSNLTCDHNALIQLDLSGNKFISYLKCNDNPNLEQLFLKNGSEQYSSSLHLFPNPSLQYICCDAYYELNDLTNYVAANGNPNTVVNSYCYFTPGNALYTIKGNVKYDSNNNGCDSNDPNKSSQRFAITDGSVAGDIITNNSGNYSIPLPAGTHTITPIFENPYFIASPASFTVNFPTQVSPLFQNFCITANGVHPDLEVVIIPITSAAPGFDATYKIVYKNKGTGIQSGNIIFNFNDDLMNYINAIPAPNSQATGILHFNFNNLLPFETKEITLTFHLNTPTQTPALNGGDILYYTAQINGTNDQTPADNRFTLNQTVVNSFDPNDKICLEGASTAQAKVGDYVHYLIRFENTGTANAQNIIVKDVIDTSKFDLSSLVPLNGSHSFVTRISGTNTAEFIFENIQLPFDDANNDGYISFKIKTKSTLTAGNSFSNTARIYFDYNTPIITNTYTTSVQNVLATSEVNTSKNDFSIYPNPVKDILYIQSKDEVIKAEIYDTAGRILNTTGVKNNSVNVSDLAKGNYIIKVSIKNKTLTLKFIKA